MMDLNSLFVSTKTITVPFPGLDGFELELQYLDKEELAKLNEKAKTIEFDPKTRQPIETIDSKLFLKLYTNAVIKGWKGLKYEYIKKLAVVDSSKLPEEGELEYSPEAAVTLVEKSPTLDGWLAEVLNDIELFNKSS